MDRTRGDRDGLFGRDRRALAGTLTKHEIIRSIKEDAKVVQFLRNCGEENLQFLLQPARLSKALDALDTNKDGEMDIEEWEEARHGVVTPSMGSRRSTRTVRGPRRLDGSPGRGGASRLTSGLHRHGRGTAAGCHVDIPRRRGKGPGSEPNDRSLLTAWVPHRPSTAASRSASSSSRRNRSAARARRPPPTRRFRRSSSPWPGWSLT